MHVHREWLIFIIYTSSQLGALVYKATQSVGSELTPWKTTGEYFRSHSVTLTLRWLICTFFLFAVWDDPELLGRILAYLGAPNWPFTINYWTAGMYGLASDKIADLILGFANKVYRLLKARTNGNDA